MKLLTTTVLGLTLAASGAMADNHKDKNKDTEANATAGQSGQQTANANANAQENTSSAEMAQMRGDLIRTRDITGGTIYTTNEAQDEGWDPTTVHDQVGAEWNQIGEIEDVVLSQDGQMTGIVAEVGGFLDVADKHVMVSIKDVNLVAADDANYAYVTRLNEEDLESMQGVDEGFWN